MLELKGLSKIYKPKKGEDVVALNNVSLKIEDTGMVFILGKSGSGKSTFLNVVGGLDKYSSGILEINGVSTAKFSQSNFDSYRNTMIGFIFQEYNVLEEFTVAQNIGLALELQGRKATSEKISEILASVDLVGYERRKPNELSGGQKQRVAIARALVKDPKIIMADEPTGALDSNTGKQVFETLEKLSESRLVIVVSHDREFAETYGSRIIEFSDGVIISDVTREKGLKNEEREIKYYENSITINQGYELTEEDVAVIQRYLKENKKDLNIIKKFNESTFNKTDVDNLKIKKEEIRFIKSKLPFGSSLKIGVSSFKHKTIRLVFSIILASVAFAFFGLTDAMSSYNKYSVLKKSVNDSKLQYIGLEKVEAMSYGDEIYFNPTNMNEADFVTLKSKFGIDFIPVYSDNYGFTYEGLHDSITEANSAFYRNSFGGLAVLTEDDITNLKMVKKAGDLPKNKNEIAITTYTFELFKKFSYKGSSNGESVKIPIVNYSDLIDKEIQVAYNYTVKIVGIYDTNFDTEHFDSLKEPPTSQGFDAGRFMLSQELGEILKYSNHNLGIVHEDLLKNIMDEKYRSIYDGGYSISFYYDNQLIQNIPYNYRKINDNHDDIVFLTNITHDNMGKYDVAISFETYLSINSSFENDIRNEFISYIETLSDQEIKDKLLEHNYYYDDYDMTYNRDSYFDLIRYDEPATYNSMYVAYAKTLFKSQPAFTFQANLIVWGDEVDNMKDMRVVGIHLPDNYDVNTYLNQYAYYKDEFLEEIGIFDKGDYTSALAALDYTNDSLVNKIVDEHYKEADGAFRFKNEITSTLDSINSLIEGTSQIFLIVGSIFAVFASLLLFNFIATSISYKKKEIGILRAIGARGNDVFGIFFKESLVIALINFLIAGFISAGVIIYLNNMIRNDYGMLITFLSFGLRQVGIMLGISVIVAFISSFFPVYKIARKRPIDAIQNK